MTSVFLSYAKEDSAAAARLMDWLRGRGVDCYSWQDPQRRGGRFIEDIEAGIAGADQFLVLLSPAYLMSSWCRHERDLALQHEIDLNRHRRFVRVIEVATTPRPATGFLRNYDALDAREPLDERKLAAVETALRLNDSGPVAARSGPAVAPTPKFRNRHDELGTVVTALQTTGGRDCWVIVSPPRMGKSWLMDRIQSRLAAEGSGWSTRLLDLREQPAALRTSAVRLLGELLDVDVAPFSSNGPLSQADLRVIAAELTSRERPQLYLLDSADLVDPESGRQLRNALSGIHHLVRQSGSTATRLGLLIGTRRHDEWRGLGKPATTTRFEPLHLTEFRDDVVRQAVKALGRDLGADREWEYALRLHRMSEGLPALLVRSLQWAVRTQFLSMDECFADVTFDKVVRPYVQADLLAVESLLPSGSTRQREAMAVLDHALRVISPYRLFTQTHLATHLRTDAAFSQALADAGWSEGELWEALSRTSLCRQSPGEPWRVLEPSIRRLLHRYYHRTVQERHDAHVVARQFYEGWTPVRTAGMEQPVVMLECLWHEASRVMIADSDGAPRRLPAAAAELAREFGASEVYQREEFTAYLNRLLDNDDELQMLVQGHSGLFGDIVHAVETAIGGER
jgi:hypothetical protein